MAKPERPFSSEITILELNDIVSHSQKDSKDDLKDGIEQNNQPRPSLILRDIQGVISENISTPINSDDSNPLRKALAQTRELDLIFFRGTDLVSKVIRCCESLMIGNGDYSHVGIVVSSKLLPNLSEYLEKDRLYVLESTMSIKKIAGIKVSDGIPDAVKKEGHLGVQIRDLEQVIRSYSASHGAKVARGQLKENPFFPLSSDTANTKENPQELLKKRRLKIQEIMVKIYEETFWDHYEVNLFSLFAAVFKCCRPTRNLIEILVYGTYYTFFKGGSIKDLHQKAQESTFFCSELVAQILQNLELLKEKKRADEYAPTHFIKYGLVEEPLPYDVTSITKDEFLEKLETYDQTTQEKGLNIVSPFIFSVECIKSNKIKDRKNKLNLEESAEEQNLLFTNSNEASYYLVRIEKSRIEKSEV